MSSHNLCFEQKYEKYQNFFYLKVFLFLTVKFSIYLNRGVFIKKRKPVLEHEQNAQIQIHPVHAQSLIQAFFSTDSFYSVQ